MKNWNVAQCTLHWSVVNNRVCSLSQRYSAPETLSHEVTMSYSGVKLAHPFREFSQWFALNYLWGWVIKYPATSHPVCTLLVLSEQMFSFFLETSTFYSRWMLCYPPWDLLALAIYLKEWWIRLKAPILPHSKRQYSNLLWGAQEKMTGKNWLRARMGSSSSPGCLEAGRIWGGSQGRWLKLGFSSPGLPPASFNNGSLQVASVGMDAVRHLCEQHGQIKRTSAFSWGGCVLKETLMKWITNIRLVLFLSAWSCSGAVKVNGRSITVTRLVWTHRKIKRVLARWQRNCAW